jgi:transcriptional regulator with XRE-family HTH domain
MSPLSPVSTLERLRLNAGLARVEVARGAPINRKTLKRLEEGHALPRARTVYRLASFYGVRPDWLLGEIRRDRLEATYERAA